mmetsp:Transcript_41614/g.89344  ORF Transcript_41614/g.89344 Transcript_41614/m.89344 type:complete len:94 (+) Transcript_41614:293-574(+)|eukprot:CAMPEP_0206572306 /NCGR_PEP_ID=MMETSP0325_2-20121206/28162_1 /ASSEMBLY_ACC=CAM_ASM_000347 /TAXON_ID=2866 /ORGANISM="Crypthecodinium cohnii, Strain Seligo" /LENGTH=93 /DNA_ID=CAMNT_0054076475 /DNA_START=243 /DNA_END=524 /DNA_ORIENTATION=+
MVIKIVNGEVVGEGSSTTLARKNSVIDRLASLFWGFIAFWILFFKTIFAPQSGTTFRPARPDNGRRQVGRINPGGSSNTMMGPGGGGCGMGGG